MTCIQSTAAAVRWSYIDSPVKITESPAGPSPVLGLCAQSAFDGYGAQGARPAAVRAWHQATLPKADSPISCEIDYGKPVSVSAFVHYFFTPECCDLRPRSTGSSAFAKVRISAKGEDGSWTQVALLDDIPDACPQVLEVKSAAAARVWKIEVLAMSPAAQVFYTYEVETYTGGVPTIPPVAEVEWDPLREFAGRVAKAKPLAHVRRMNLVTGDGVLGLVDGAPGAKATASIELLVDGQIRKLAKGGGSAWKADVPGGVMSVRAEAGPCGNLLTLAFKASSDHPAKYVAVSLRLSVPDASLYYIPAYAWSAKPVDTAPHMATLHTRLASLAKSGDMYCLMPGTDRGLLGVSENAATAQLVVGERPVPVLVSCVKGGWWDAYQFAVRDVYGFSEQRQSVPVSEIQHGISNYILRDEIWEPALGTLRSWPPRDPHYELYGKGFDVFSFYGATYSLPSYLARYRMVGDQLALERAKSIARWLCQSGVRQKDGPCKGAFYNLQRFTNGEQVRMDEIGCTQAGKSVLTIQSTGSALWTLLYYRAHSGESSPEVDSAISEAAGWLLRLQNPDGGWPYACEPNGEVVPGAPSSGSIWNIWALWRLGAETGDRRYTDAASRAVAWFDREFVRRHHYHGYWEDVGPNSREGYDAAIAAVVFDEIGRGDLVVETARDAVQWVYTRRLEHRDANNSTGLVAEQTGWPPAAYCNPMMALAAHSAWRRTGDEFFRAFAMIPKAIGWWYQADTGAMVWIVDSISLAPIVGPRFESWWSDWCIAQTDTLALRWLVREVNRQADGAASIDEETLRGKLLGRSVTAWAPRAGWRPCASNGGQMNWLGFRDDDSLFLVVMNYGGPGNVECKPSAQDLLGARATPAAVHAVRKSKSAVSRWSGAPVRLAGGECAVLEWRLVR